MNMELRFNETELRVNQDGSMNVAGYVNKTNQLSEIMGHAKRFREKIAKGAFAQAIANATRDIDFLAEHDDDRILASTRNSSLSLREDDEGLYMEATIAPTSYGKDSYELIKSGILRNMSFGFRVIKDNWKMIQPNLFERTVEQLELVEVSVVRDPAYSQSSIAARGIHVIEEVNIPPEMEEEARQMEELSDLLKTLNSTVLSLENELKELRNLNEQRTITINIDGKEITKALLPLKEEERSDENNENVEKIEVKVEETAQKIDENQPNETPKEPEKAEKEQENEVKDEVKDEKKDEKVEEIEKKEDLEDKKEEEKSEKETENSENKDNKEEILAGINKLEQILESLRK